jgi:NADPH2:quinone reductase
MKSVVVKSFGGLDVLTLVELPEPRARAGQCVVEVEAAGVGIVDVLMRRGLYPSHSKPGFVPGVEIAGTIVEVAPGEDESRLGQRVYAFTEGGGCTQRIAFSAKELIPLPPGLSAAGAVALGVNALGAKIGLERACARRGESVLVRGAGGGMGVMATQFAARTGAVVHVTTSSEERAERLRALGATITLDRLGKGKNGDISEFDVIFDPVCGPNFGDLISRLRPNGRLLVCGIAGGFPSPDFGMALVGSFQKSLTLSTFSVNVLSSAEVAATMTEVFALACTGALKLVVQEVLPLERVADAHALLERGEVFGKLVLAP